MTIHECGPCKGAAVVFCPRSHARLMCVIGPSVDCTLHREGDTEIAPGNMCGAAGVVRAGTGEVVGRRLTAAAGSAEGPGVLCSFVTTDGVVGGVLGRADGTRDGAAAGSRVG